MAEGGTQQRSFKDSYSKASGDADESFCDPCINGGKWITVEGYCQICKEYLCENCLVVHRNQKITRSHTILDKNQMPRGQVSNASQGLCVEVCKTHHPEIVKFYCKAHDEPGCGDCMALNHSTCNKDRIQDISDGFQATKEFKLIQQKLNKFHTELEVMKETLDNNLKNLGTTYNNIQHKISSFRKQINDYLDQMQKQITDEAEIRKKEHEAEMKRLKAENESMKSELEDILQRIQKDPDMNSIFVLTKQAKQRLVTMEKELNHIKQTEQQQKHYVFSPSFETERIISAKTPLGKLTNINITASHRGNINVKSEDDKDWCWINECTLISPQRMVSTDGINNTIKLIDMNDNRVICSYKTWQPSYPPVGITTVSADTVAVTLPDDKKIVLFHVKSKLTKKCQIKLNYSDKRCSGIAYKNGKFAVSYTNPGSVEILDTQGHVLHEIQPKQGKAAVLLKPFNVAFGHDNDTVIVADAFTHKVSIISFGGQILQTYTHDALKAPCGMAITADGVLFVCSSGNGCIFAVSPDFKTSKIIIKNDSNVVSPASITYCDINHRLYINNNIDELDILNNSLQVYDLNV